jgi:hypothetical protein
MGEGRHFDSHPEEHSLFLYIGSRFRVMVSLKGKGHFFLESDLQHFGFKLRLKISSNPELPKRQIVNSEILIS